MKAYRLSVNLKLGLIIFAILMVVASLAYTNQLISRLLERERASVQIWADANEQLVSAANDNPFREELLGLDQLLSRLHRMGSTNPLVEEERMQAFREAVNWAQQMPPDDQITFLANITTLYYIDIPAILTDSSNNPVGWRNISVPDAVSLSRADSLKVLSRLEEMAELYPPIPIELEYDRPLRQYVYYDESELVKELRIYPYLQLLFVSLFILVGYLGFSYVRRSEQSSLWVGMAREAAHQLGTPISSLMGWLELLRMREMEEEQYDGALDEVEKDIERLSRVANRFSDIGSLPKLQPLSLATVLSNTADYIRRRIPQQGKRVTLDVNVQGELVAPLNAELFEWVIENLLKNALDAIEKNEGSIQIAAQRVEDRVQIDVIDSGKGIDRRQWKNVFRPGYSTKKRGWGLGLSLAKRIVEDYHGGTLTLAQSKVGKGSTFRIEIPLLEKGKARKRS